MGGGLYVLFILLLVPGLKIDNYFSRTDFDSEKWKKWEMTEGVTLRWEMVDDLQKDYELDGMTEGEMVKFPGEPGQNPKLNGHMT